MSLISSTTRLKRYIGISGTDDDSLLAELIAEIDAKAKLIMGGRIVESTVYANARIDGSGRDELLLPQFPVTALSDVRMANDYAFADATVLVEDDDYTYDPDSGIITHLSGVWSEGVRNVRLTFTAGYATVPDDLIEAASHCVADRYTRAKQLASGQSQAELVSESLSGGRSESHRSDMDPQWNIPATAVAVFKQYRKRG